MARSTGHIAGPVVGFNRRAVPVASSQLTRAVAASLALGVVSLCLIVLLTALCATGTFAAPL